MDEERSQLVTRGQFMVSGSWSCYQLRNTKQRRHKLTALPVWGGVNIWTINSDGSGCRLRRSCGAMGRTIYEERWNYHKESILIHQRPFFSSVIESKGDISKITSELILVIRATRSAENLLNIIPCDIITSHSLRCWFCLLVSHKQRGSSGRTPHDEEARHSQRETRRFLIRFRF